MADTQLGRFWQHRGEDGVRREKQLLIDFLCASAGGPRYYRGRDMATAHRGRRISESDWMIVLNHVNATLDKFAVPAREQGEALAFVANIKKDIVDYPLQPSQTPSHIFSRLSSEICDTTEA